MRPTDGLRADDAMPRTAKASEERDALRAELVPRHVSIAHQTLQSWILAQRGDRFSPVASCRRREL